MEIAPFLWFLSVLASPFLITFLVLVAAPNRWVFAGSALIVAVGLVGFTWSLPLDLGAGGIGITPLLTMVLAGLVVGALAWIAEAIRRQRRGTSSPEILASSIVLYVIAAGFLASATWPSWQFW